MIQPFKVDKVPIDGKIEKEGEHAIVIMRSTMHNDYKLIRPPSPLSERSEYLLPTNSVLRKRVELKREDLYSKLQHKGDLKSDVFEKMEDRNIQHQNYKFGKQSSSRSSDSSTTSTVSSNKNNKNYKLTEKGQNPNDVEFKKDFSKLSSNFITKNNLLNASKVGRRKQTNNNAKNINELFKPYNLDEPTYSFDCRRKKNVDITLYSSMFH
jgi:hypothetical protein